MKLRTLKTDFAKQEVNALILMSRDDMRSPWEEIRWIVVQEAKRRGYLPNDPQAAQEQP